MRQPPLMLLHGFMGTTLAHFGKVIKQWYGTTPIVGVDLPGHGSSSYEGNLNHYYDKTIDYVIKRISLHQKVNLIGMSYLGGTVALKIALQQPKLVHKLILTGFTYNVPQKAFCAWANGFKELTTQQLILRNEYRRLHGEKWSIMMDAVIQHINSDYEVSIKTTTSMLKTLSIPTLLVNGDYKDNESSAVNHFKRLSTFCSGEIIHGAGHIVTHDQPIMFCQTINNFLSEN